MQHARYECPSATLRRTLKRRSSSTYEASGFFSVMSASSAFSAAWPEYQAAICLSCKPTLLCSNGCSAAAVHSVCRGSCGQFTVSAHGDGGSALGPPHGPRPYRQKRPRTHAACARARACRNCPRTHAACARARACRNCWLPERARQVAACYMRHEKDGVNDMHRATCNGQHPHSGHPVCCR